MVNDLFERIETTPLASRAREAILEAILEERFDGDRLPAEDELARMLNVSRTTIRTALHSLERDGIITRRRAVGTTINRHIDPDVLALQRMVGFDWLLKERGHKVKVDISWSQGPAPAELAKIFDMDPEAECCLTEKLYFADGELAIFIRDLVLWSELDRALDRKIPASLFDFSARYCRHRIDHAVAHIAPMVKRDEDTTKLDVGAEEPFVRLYERHFSSTADPVAFSVIDVDDRFIRFEVFRRQQR
jgi:GntR family transcriptional regulator